MSPLWLRTGRAGSNRFSSDTLTVPSFFSCRLPWCLDLCHTFPLGRCPRLRRGSSVHIDVTQLPLREESIVMRNSGNRQFAAWFKSQQQKSRS